VPDREWWYVALGSCGVGNWDGWLPGRRLRRASDSAWSLAKPVRLGEVVGVASSGLGRDLVGVVGDVCSGETDLMDAPPVVLNGLSLRIWAADRVERVRTMLVTPLALLAGTAPEREDPEDMSEREESVRSDLEGETRPLL
jgi:hypothetical protein